MMIDLVLKPGEPLGVGTGLAFTLCGALHLGAISNLVARPVLRGYTFGLALVIAVKQWPILVGMHTHSSTFPGLLVELLLPVVALPPLPLRKTLLT